MRNKKNLVRVFKNPNFVINKYQLTVLLNLILICTLVILSFSFYNCSSERSTKTSKKL